VLVPLSAPSFQKLTFRAPCGGCIASHKRIRTQVKGGSDRFRRILMKGELTDDKNRPLATRLGLR